MPGNECSNAGDGDTPQPLQRRGFFGQPAHRRAYAPTGLSSPVQDGDGGVVVSIKRESTATINPVIREGKRLEDMPVWATLLPDAGSAPWS